MVSDLFVLAVEDKEWNSCNVPILGGHINESILHLNKSNIEHVKVG